MNSVENTLSKTLSSDDVNFWTNSKVTLTWISAVEKEYKTFVENLKNCDVSEQFYCNTKENPAELLKRSKIFENFRKNKFWF